jgi:hypothetical protein
MNTMLLLIQLLFTTFIAAEENEVIIARCEDFKVSGDGSAGAWSSTQWINLTQRVDQPVTYRTRAKVLYSETGIYFLFDCQDQVLNASITENDQDLWEEDVVEVFLWTGEDFPVYFEYEISPLNYELTIMVPNHEGRFFGWLPWHYEGGRKTEHATTIQGGQKEPFAKIESWMAEFFIPYKLLTPLPQVPPGPGTKWRANLYRIDYDQGQTTFSWQETSKTFHEYKNFGTFIFE